MKDAERLARKLYAERQDAASSILDLGLKRQSSFIYPFDKYDALRQTSEKPFDNLTDDQREKLIKHAQDFLQLELTNYG